MCRSAVCSLVIFSLLSSVVAVDVVVHLPLPPPERVVIGRGKGVDRAVLEGLRKGGK